MDNKIFFVIPAYNEGKKIGEVIRGLLKAGYNNIVVIDDCSRDNTYEVCSKLPVHLLRHVINRGQGAALQTGIDYALRQGAEYIVTFDSDGQHRVEDLPAMLKPVTSGEVEATLGSRFLKKAKLPLRRKLMLKTAIVVQWLFYGVKLSDAHNGYRVFSRRAAQKIRISQDRMEHASEIVEEIVHKRIKYREVPVTIRYTGYSQAKGAASFLGALKILYRMIIKKLLS